MREIIARGDAFERQEVSRDAARTLFADKGERFKVELIDDLPEGEAITLYRQGDWVDLCRGPHAPSTAYVGKAFKLTHVSGAYWRGDSKREQMQRIYGTAWESKAQLDAHLTRLEEAEKRDHRKIGRAMDLFHIQEEAVGSIFWHPKGWALYRTVESYMRRRLEKSGYQEVKSPQLIDRKLWEASGHWDKFREEMFTTHDDGDARILALKPMNCPGHVQIFRQGLKSYRERRCGSLSSAPVTGTSLQERCTALCASAHLRRTMRTSSARLSKSTARLRPFAPCYWTSMPISASTRWR